MAFLFQDQNQGIRIDTPAAKTPASRPFSFIRTLTVGFGITPNLLTLPQREEGARGLGQIDPYRRWGLSPRPENISRPVERPRQLCPSAAVPASAILLAICMSTMTARRDFTVIPGRALFGANRESRNSARCWLPGLRPRGRIPE
jgi:hypothetical protein